MRNFVTRTGLFSLLTICLVLTSIPAQAVGTAEIFSLIANGKLKDAQAQTSELLKTSPDDPELIFAQALIAERSGQEDQAAKIYQSLTLSHPGLLAPYNNLAIHHVRSGDYQAAVDTLERAMQSQPAVAVAYRNLTAIYAQLASAAYRKALNSSEPLAPLNLASMGEIDPGRSNDRGVQPTLVASVENFVNESLQNNESTAPETTAKPAQKTVVEINTAQQAEREAAVTDSSPGAASEQDEASEETAGLQTEQSSKSNQTASTQPAPTVREIEPGPEPVVIASVTPAAEARQAVENNAAQKQALIDHIKSWANAWSDRDVDRYLSHYSENFLPRNNLSLAEWKKQRHGRLRWREFIIVKPSKYSISIEGNSATVNFNQYYKSERFEDTIRKTMKLDNENGRWLITRELI